MNIRLNIFSLGLVLSLWACDQRHSDPKYTSEGKIDVYSPSLPSDTLIAKLNKLGQQKQVQVDNQKGSLDFAVRFIDFPGDAHWNGAPITEQMNLSHAQFSLSSDTLIELSLSKFEDYKQFYPKSISCDFEGGTSREFINYPKRLVFRYELFENELAHKPYLIKEVIVERNHSGELSCVY